MRARLVVAILAATFIVAACGGLEEPAQEVTNGDAAPSPEDASAIDAPSDAVADAGCRIAVPNSAKDKGPFIVCD